MYFYQVRDLDPTNQLTFVRIASKKHEVKHFVKLLIVITPKYCIFTLFILIIVLLLGFSCP